MEKRTLYQLACAGIFTLTSACGGGSITIDVKAGSRMVDNPNSSNPNYCTTTKAFRAKALNSFSAGPFVYTEIEPVDQTEAEKNSCPGHRYRIK